MSAPKQAMKYLSTRGGEERLSFEEVRSAPSKQASQASLGDTTGRDCFLCIPVA